MASRPPREVPTNMAGAISNAVRTAERSASATGSHAAINQSDGRHPATGYGVDEKAL